MSTEFFTRLITAAEFQELDSDVPSELVRGEIVEMTRPGLRHGVVCGNVAFVLRTWGESVSKYLIASNDTGVLTERNPDTLRGPDVIVIHRDKLPGGELTTGSVTVPPDLVVEVLSPHDRWSQVLDKTTEYLDVGAKAVWVVDPEEKAVHLFRADVAPRSLRGEELLIDESVLPGFQIRVKQLFAGI